MTDATRDDSTQLIAYATDDSRSFSIVRASQEREWMSRTIDKFANRCLPLLMANQFGWDIILNEEVSCWWSGGDDRNSLRVLTRKGKSAPIADSHFGHGVLTFRIPFLFTTTPGVYLYVKGPANQIRKSVVPLEGLVETDWAPMTFTMNWKVTNRFRRVVFREGEPICRIIPFQSDYIEKIDPSIECIDANAKMKSAYKSWSASRNSFNALLKLDSGTQAEGWQKDYFLGRPSNGAERAISHRTKLKLRDFRDRRHEGGVPPPSDAG